MKSALSTLALFLAAFLVVQCTTACKHPSAAIGFVLGPFTDWSEPEEYRKARIIREYLEGEEKSSREEKNRK